MTAAAHSPLDVICFSLERWDEIWRRNQWFATEMLDADPQLRILFAELPIDALWATLHGKLPSNGRLRPVGTTGRLWATAPYKLLPRRVWAGADKFLASQVLRAARQLGMRRPVLWINDSTYADLAVSTGWPSVYDVTDDWLLANRDDRHLARERRHDTLLLDNATEVVVCSPALAESRGRRRAVRLISNGVDIEHIRCPQPRPVDLPEGRIALYQGTATRGRLDLDLCVELAAALGKMATLVLVGPCSLSEADTDRLRDAGVVLLGAKPYTTIPGYLQHADVLVVPHAVNAFTESLDPIKAREFVAVGRPTVSTPVAGFRTLGGPVRVAERDRFVSEVLAVLAAPPLAAGPGPLTTPPTTWKVAASEFLTVLRQAAADRPAPADRPS